MTFYDQNRPFGAPVAPREAPPTDSLSWTDAAYFMRIHGQGFHAPAHMRGMTLAQLEAKAREETREVREAQEAKECAARIENAPKAIERALLDGPSSKSMQAMPAQRGWRLRVRFLNHLRRCRTYREAAARVGVDESTARRWRTKYEAFGARCDEIVAERYRQNADDLKLRAGEPRSRPYFFKGKQIGEQVMHDDRALMFLMKLEDGQRARAEAREERKEERAHEIRLREMEIEARREERAAARPPKQSRASERAEVGKALAAAFREARSEMHASAAHQASPAGTESSTPIKGLDGVPADIAPPRVVEAARRPRRASEGAGGEESEERNAHVPLAFGREVR
jgi:hypothetical protein